MSFSVKKKKKKKKTYLNICFVFFLFFFLITIVLGWSFYVVHFSLMHHEATTSKTIFCSMHTMQYQSILLVNNNSHHIFVNLVGISLLLPRLLELLSQCLFRWAGQFGQYGQQLKQHADISVVSCQMHMVSWFSLLQIFIIIYKIVGF